MLRAVVQRFLEIASEREFDGPLLALLSTEGFTDVHFAHGSFEFGKDVIAKRVDEDGVQRQYCIQSKAGDINQGSWREVRPQLEEAEYNTRVHPGYDATLPRVAVLVTTGRLKGAAGVDAQEFAQAAASRGLATFEVWDREKFIAWICESPSVGLAGSSVQTDFLRVVTAIRDGSVSEPQIEQYTRGWVESAGSVRPWVECAIMVAELTAANRLDLAAYVALDLLRAGHSGLAQSPITEDVPGRLFCGIGVELLTLVEPLLSSPNHLANASVKTSGLVSYPVVCCRLTEIFALLSLWAAQAGDEELTLRSRSALKLMVDQPGSWRPPSDAFAASVIAATLALSQIDPSGGSGLSSVRR